MFAVAESRQFEGDLTSTYRSGDLRSTVCFKKKRQILGSGNPSGDSDIAIWIDTIDRTRRSDWHLYDIAALCPFELNLYLGKGVLLVLQQSRELYIWIGKLPRNTRRFRNGRTWLDSSSSASVSFVGKWRGLSRLRRQELGLSCLLLFVTTRHPPPNRNAGQYDPAAVTQKCAHVSESLFFERSSVSAMNERHGEELPARKPARAPTHNESAGKQRSNCRLRPPP